MNTAVVSSVVSPVLWSAEPSSGLHNPGMLEARSSPTQASQVARYETAPWHGSKMAIGDNAPVDRGSREATFTVLAADFGFDDKIKGIFLKGPMETLEDFRYYFADEKEIDAFVASEETLEGPEQRIQIARVRQAWAAVRQDGLRKEYRNTISSVANPQWLTQDDSLEEETLRETKVQFWKRYKAKYPMEAKPSDQLLYHCYKEIEKRRLTVYDIWGVRTLLHQVMTVRMRRKTKQADTDLYTFEDEVYPLHGVEKYLVKLHAYLLALSIAGSSRVQGAPVEEAFGNDADKFVKVPWEVLQAYYLRAARAVRSMPEAHRSQPEASRLAWLEERDIAERAVWVSQFREGDETLGQVVQAVMEKRGAHWDVVRPSQAPSHGHDMVARPSQAPQSWRGPTTLIPSHNPNEMTPVTTAAALRDGNVLCPYWNAGKCKRNTRELSCDEGLHLCAKVLRKGRICGMRFHGAHNCRDH
jgi:hypothetical protein